MCLGNNIWRIADGKQMYPTGATEGLRGDVASLSEFRTVAFHSLRREKGGILYEFMSADVGNA